MRAPNAATQRAPASHSFAEVLKRSAFAFLRRHWTEAFAFPAATSTKMIPPHIRVLLGLNELKLGNIRTRRIHPRRNTAPLPFRRCGGLAEARRLVRGARPHPSPPSQHPSSPPRCGRNGLTRPRHRGLSPAELSQSPTRPGPAGLSQSSRSMLPSLGARSLSPDRPPGCTHELSPRGARGFVSGMRPSGPRFSACEPSLATLLCDQSQRH